MSTKNDRKHYYDAFVNRVMFPIIDLRGNVLAFSGRAITSDVRAKYVNTSDTLIYKKGENIFALNFAKKSGKDSLILCEGNMDVVSLHQAGFDNAVAGLGTALTEQQASLLSRYASEILLCYDNDEAGQKAARKALALFSKTTVHVKVINMEGGKDPDEIIKKYGPERFKALMNGAANDIEYKLLKAREGFNLNTSDGKVKFLEAACAVLAQVKSPVELDVYAGRLSEELGVDKQAILLQAKRVHKNNAYRNKKEKLKEVRDYEKTAAKATREVNPEREKHLRAARAEEVLLASLMNNPAFFGQLKNSISSDLFITSFNRRVFEAVREQIESNGEFMLSALSDSSFTSEEISAVARIQTLIPQLANTLTECRDCIKVLSEEKAKNVPVNPAGLSDEDFLKLFHQQ